MLTETVSALYRFVLKSNFIGRLSPVWPMLL
jgi:hypothetical protein